MKIEWFRNISTYTQARNLMWYNLKIRKLLILMRQGPRHFKHKMQRMKQSCLLSYRPTCSTLQKSSIFLLSVAIYFYVYGWFSYMDVCDTCACLLSTEVLRHQIPQIWSCKCCQLPIRMMLGIQFESFKIEATLFKGPTISPLL